MEAVQDRPTAGDAAASAVDDQSSKRVLERLEAARLAPTDRTVSDDEIRRLLTAVVRLYAARVEASGEFPVPLTKDATATDIVLIACEMMRAENINFFDLMMWYDRRRSP